LTADSQNYHATIISDATITPDTTKLFTNMSRILFLIYGEINYDATIISSEMMVASVKMMVASGVMVASVKMMVASGVMVASEMITPDATIEVKSTICISILQ
jgi:hypothetical protein